MTKKEREELRKRYYYKGVEPRSTGDLEHGIGSDIMKSAKNIYKGARKTAQGYQRKAHKYIDRAKNAAGKWIYAYPGEVIRNGKVYAINTGKEVKRAADNAGKQAQKTVNDASKAVNKAAKDASKWGNQRIREAQKAANDAYRNVNKGAGSLRRQAMQFGNDAVKSARRTASNAREAVTGEKERKKYNKMADSVQKAYDSDKRRNAKTGELGGGRKRAIKDYRKKAERAGLIGKARGAVEDTTKAASKWAGDRFDDVSKTANRAAKSANKAVKGAKKKFDKTINDVNTLRKTVDTISKMPDGKLKNIAKSGLEKGVKKKAPALYSAYKGAQNVSKAANNVVKSAKKGVKDVGDAVSSNAKKASKAVKSAPKKVADVTGYTAKKRLEKAKKNFANDVRPRVDGTLKAAKSPGSLYGNGGKRTTANVEARKLKKAGVKPLSSTAKKQGDAYKKAQRSYDRTPMGKAEKAAKNVQKTLSTNINNVSKGAQQRGQAMLAASLQAAGWTKQQIAKRLGVTVSQITKWLK